MDIQELVREAEKITPTIGSKGKTTPEHVLASPSSSPTISYIPPSRRLCLVYLQLNQPEIFLWFSSYLLLDGKFPFTWVDNFITMPVRKKYDTITAWKLHNLSWNPWNLPYIKICKRVTFPLTDAVTTARLLIPMLYIYQCCILIKLFED